MARNPLTIERAFDAARLRNVFRDHVWAALRGQQCQDLLFYYDYRRAIGTRAQQLAAVICSGNYRPRASLPIAISRSDLLARNMHIPHPDDAVVLQCISEALLPVVEKRKPSTNAVFARSHIEPQGLHTIGQLRIYPWFRLWPRYQERILKFAKTRKYLVITDVQNFFDSVGFSFVRSVFGREVPKSETLINLMLLLFENFKRRQMYAPVQLLGIPTVNVDAPRLVGHALLFNVDKYLKKQTKRCFARWLDDINFGVNTIKEAREHIRIIDALLKNVGLRLGGSKTQILSYSEAREYLQQEENQRLNVIETRLGKAASMKPAVAREICRGFLRFRAQPDFGYWDKVMRRYYGMVARANATVTKKSPAFQALIRKIEAISRADFREITATTYREAIVKFWGTLPPTDARVKHYLAAFIEIHNYDDATAFALCEALCNLNLSAAQIKTVISALLLLIGKAESPGYYYGACWFLAKFGARRNISEFINRTAALWEANYFFARQAVSLWSLLPISTPALTIRERFMDTHNSEIIGTVKFIEDLRTTKTLDKSLKGVLPANERIQSLDLRRALISSNVMRSPVLDKRFRDRNSARIKILSGDRRLSAIALGGTAS